LLGAGVSVGGTDVIVGTGLLLVTTGAGRGDCGSFEGVLMGGWNVCGNNVGVLAIVTASFSKGILKAVGVTVFVAVGVGVLVLVAVGVPVGVAVGVFVVLATGVAVIWLGSGSGDGVTSAIKRETKSNPISKVRTIVAYSVRFD
jgi:hypothetical protein